MIKDKKGIKKRIESRKKQLHNMKYGKRSNSDLHRRIADLKWQLYLKNNK